MNTENRLTPRIRTLLTGTVIANGGRMIISAAVKDFSGTGAKLKLGSTAQIPDSFELMIRDRPERYRAMCAWRKDDTMGIALVPIEEPLDVRLRRAVRARQALRVKRARLNSEY
jgi:hypothetical protein